MTGFRSQLSLETMLLVAALAAFAAVLIPEYAKAGSMAKGVLAGEMQELALDRIAALASQAQVLGAGTRIEGKVGFLADETFLRYDEGNSSLELSHGIEGYEKTFRRKTAFPIAVAGEQDGSAQGNAPGKGFQRGQFKVIAETENNGTVTIAIIPAAGSGGMESG